MTFRTILILACLFAVVVGLALGLVIWGEPNVHGLMFVPIGNGVIIPMQY